MQQNKPVFWSEVPAEKITSFEIIMVWWSDNRIWGRSGWNANLFQLAALIVTDTKTKIRLRKGIESMRWIPQMVSKIISYYLAGWTTKNKGAFHLG